MKDNKYTKHLILCVVGLFLLVILTKGITYAKYISDKAFNYYLASKGFYFESDELTESTNKIIDTSWDGEKVYFNIKNSSNKFIASESDIEYELTCAVEEETTTKICSLDGSNESNVTGKLAATIGCINETKDGVDTSSFTEEQCSNYTWGYMGTNKEHYFEVYDEEGKTVDNATVILTAKSTSPYVKTISAKYILTKDSSNIGTLSVNYESKNKYENVIITNSYNEDKCLKLSWNANDLILDTDSNEFISSKTNSDKYVNEIVFKLPKKDSINYIFYKTDKTKTYTNTDFNLVESTECQ